MRHSAVLATAACLVTGAALYVTRGVLDQLVTPEGPVRVALFPPWQALVGFTALAAIGLLWLSSRHSPRGTTTALVRPPIGRLALPGLASSLLLVPYLPWLPDAWPFVQALAGPLRGIVWLVLIVQLVWVSWRMRPPRLRWLDGAPLWQLAAGVGLAVAVTSGVVATRLTGTVLFPAGDEPHYLVIAQSLWRDGDLAIENNHQRGDYRDYFTRDLEPHYLTRGADGKIYSIHPVGLPVLVAPIYAAGGYRAVVGALVLMAALAAALAWALVARMSGPGAATFAVAAIGGTSPFLLNTFTVYPEIAAGLAVMIAVTMAFGGSPRAGAGRWVACGVAAAMLPWLSSKYALMSGALLLVAAGRAWTSRADAPGLPRSLAALAVPYALSIAAWFAFFQAYWGSPWPSAPYGALLQTSPLNLVEGAPGLLFDQEYGLLAYAPVYALALSGLAAMWRSGGEPRRRALELAVIFGALWATVGAFRIWWGGSAAPARPLASGLLLLAMPIAAAFAAAGAGTARRAGHHALLWLSVGLTVVLVVAQNGLLIANDRDGTSRLLEYLSPRWPAWTMAPSFVHHEPATALVQAGVWVLAGLAGVVVLARVRTHTPGGASLAALGAGTAVVTACALAVPALTADGSQPGIDLRARSRLDVLDAFDRAALPNAVLYAPLRPVEPVDLEPLIHLTVEPGARRDPQPIRVLHNGRFSLPAGRYAVEVIWSGGARGEGVQLGLQVGRIGPPLATWTVTPSPGGTWRETFVLPASANFVALRGDVAIEPAIAVIRFTPIDVVDAGMRPRTPPVLSARADRGVVMLFHDEQIYPEASGFWSVGGARTLVTLAFGDEAQPRVLRVHSGGIPNRTVLSGHGWRRTLDLTPAQPVDVPLPEGPSVFHLAIDTRDAYVPARRDPASTDERRLGIWVEIPR
ncbi:MAG: hypothetical protein AB1635_06185 [Acidobacteriota bacterium]